MKRLALCFLLALAVNPVYAKEYTPTIVLKEIKVVKATEKSGDELYVNVTEYMPNGKTKTVNIPVSPLAWASKDLAKIKELKLWSNKLAEGQSADIMMTFVEQDNPPFDPDDLLGMVHLKIQNTKKGLKTLWSVREGSIKSPEKDLPGGKKQEFTLTGAGGTYKINMKLHD